MITNQKILVVDDDKDTARMTALLLETWGMEADVAFDAAQAIQIIEADAPAILLLDVQMPGMNGVQLCQHIKPTYKGGIIMLTAQVDEMTELSAFNTGVDDYITKPMRPHLLLARIKALLARLQSAPQEASDLKLGPLMIDVSKRIVTINNTPLDLTDAEFDILTILGEHCGHIVSRDMICESLKGYTYDGLARFIDVRVSNLRRKIGTLCKDEPIRTIRGVGYMLQTA